MHRLEVENESGVTVVSARGELDAYAAPDLAEVFGGLSRSDLVVVDLELVSFLDSTALGAISRAVREIGERGGAVRVVLPGTTARRIFEITTLDRVLPVAQSRSLALSEVAEDE